MVPLLYASRLPPDVVLLHTSMPHDGTVSLGTEVNVLPAAIEAARKRGGLVIAQLDPAMPYVYGDGVLPLAWMDLTIEASDPPGSPVPPVVDDAAKAVAQNVALRIQDGATMPDRPSAASPTPYCLLSGTAGAFACGARDQRRRPGPGEGRQP